MIYKISENRKTSDSLFNVLLITSNVYFRPLAGLELQCVKPMTKPFPLERLPLYCASLHDAVPEVLCLCIAVSFDQKCEDIIYNKI